MMRRKDLSGANECTVACSLMARCIDSRLAAVKISGACKLVMRRVLLGCAGWESGGRSERSRDILGDRDFRGPDLGDESFDTGGVEMSIATVAIV